MDISKEQPLVSVGIPTYDRPEGLRRALECITGQTYRNIEIIVSDNCSPGEATQDVIRDFMKKDPRIRHYRQDRNKGAFFNGLFVLEKAAGKYFMWAADDDRWDRRFIEKCLEKMDDNTVLCFSESMVTYPDGKEDFLPSKKVTKGLSKAEGLRRLLLDQRRNREFYGVMRTDIARKYKFTRTYGEDHVFLFYLGLKGEVVKTEPGLFFTNFASSGYRSEEEALKSNKYPRRFLYFGYIYQMVETMKALYRYGDGIKRSDKLKILYWIFHKYFFVHHFNYNIRLKFKRFFKDLFNGRLKGEGERYEPEA